MSELQEIKKQIDAINFKYDLLIKRKEKNKLELIQADNDRILNTGAVELLTSFAEWTREQIKIKIETLANSALSAVFPDKKMAFKLIGKRTKTGLLYETYLDTNGTLTPVFDAKGGGVLDIISLALRISYLKLYQGQLEQILILDEPFKNLDYERITYAVEWLSKITKDMDISIITATHISELSNNADVVFSVSNIDGKSIVEKLTGKSNDK